jgi:hypothetical protein
MASSQEELPAAKNPFFPRLIAKILWDGLLIPTLPNQNNPYTSSFLFLTRNYLCPEDALCHQSSRIFAREFFFIDPFSYNVGPSKGISTELTLFRIHEGR